MERPPSSERPKNILLTPPDIVDLEDEKREPKEFRFTWSSGESAMSFGTTAHGPFVELEFFGELPDWLSEEEKSKFEGSPDGSYRYAIGHAPQRKKTEQAAPSGLPKEVLQEEQERAGVSEVESVESVKKLAELLRGRKFVFYTGAGVSLAAGVPDMGGLKRGLGVHEEQSAEELARQALGRPEELLAKWQEIIAKATAGEPSRGHRALAKLARRYGVQVLTENLDRLHELSGIRAHHVQATDVGGLIPEAALADLDAIVTVGLRTDDNGLIRKFRQLNPRGRVIAINLSAPEYAQAGDALVPGDLHRALAELEERTREKP